MQVFSSVVSDAFENPADYRVFMTAEHLGLLQAVSAMSSEIEYRRITKKIPEAFAQAKVMLSAMSSSYAHAFGEIKSQQDAKNLARLFFARKNAECRGLIRVCLFMAEGASRKLVAEAMPLHDMVIDFLADVFMCVFTATRDGAIESKIEGMISNNEHASRLTNELNIFIAGLFNENVDGLK
jgi:hypothetical protein